MSQTDKNPHLSALYNKLSAGDLSLLGTLKKIAQTARQIDPSCPYGAHGVLGSLATYDFSPKEMKKFFNLCKNDVRMINAIDYSIYREKLSVSVLKAAVKRNFKAFSPNDYVQYAMRDGATFSKYYNPKIG